MSLGNSNPEPDRTVETQCYNSLSYMLTRFEDSRRKPNKYCDNSFDTEGNMLVHSQAPEMMISRNSGGGNSVQRTLNLWLHE